MILASYCILYRVNYISIYTYIILFIIYVLSYTCISATVSDHLHTFHLYFVIVIVFVIYVLSYTCISVTVIVYAIYIYVILFIV